MARRWIITVAGVLGVVAYIVVAFVVIMQRGDWTYPADRVTATADVRLADTESFTAVVVSVGGPARHNTGVPPGMQAVLALLGIDEGGRPRWAKRVFG